MEAKAIAQVREGVFHANGIPIRYIEQGSGPAVVLLHSGFRYAERWAELDFYGPWDGYRMIAMDQRGHGKSGKPHDPAAYGLEMARDVARLLDHLGIARAHLIGHSMGAEVALKAASLYPDRLYSAVLAGSGWGDDSVFELVGRLADSLERGEGVRPLAEWWAPPGQPPTADEVRKLSEWLLAGNDERALVALLRASVGLEGLRLTEGEVRAIQVPLLGVAGDHDPERASLERMTGVAPHFTMVVLPGLGHYGPEFFRALAQKAAAFIRKITPPETKK